MELTCKPDEVIYFPAMSVSGNNRRIPKCTFGKYVCGGMTSGLLVQENECYWKNKCSVQWDGMSKIVMSKEIKCIGQTASVLGSSGHRCIHKGMAVFSMFFFINLTSEELYILSCN